RDDVAARAVDLAGGLEVPQRVAVVQDHRLVEGRLGADAHRVVGGEPGQRVIGGGAGGGVGDARAVVQRDGVRGGVVGGLQRGGGTGLAGVRRLAQCLVARGELDL